MDRLKFPPRHQQFAAAVDGALANVQRSSSSLGVAEADNDVILSCTRLQLLHLLRVNRK